MKQDMARLDDILFGARFNRRTNMDEFKQFRNFKNYWAKTYTLETFELIFLYIFRKPTSR
jgi:hypothetical protein